MNPTLKKTLIVASLLYVGSQIPNFVSGFKAGWNYAAETGKLVTPQQAFDPDWQKLHSVN